MRRFTLILPVLIALAACSKPVDPAERLAEAEELLRHRGGDAWHRGIALGKYRDVLDADPTADQKLRAEFGIGMIGALDLIQAVPLLVDGLSGGDDAGADSASLPDAADLAPTIATLLRELLGTGIVERWRAVVALDEFSFTFSPLDDEARGLILDLGDSELDLNGTWDLTEIRLVYGALQTVLAVVELAYAWDGLVVTGLQVALGSGEVPEMPASPAAIPAWLADALVARGVSPLPWLDPAFGVLPDAGRLTPIRARLADGLSALAGAFDHVAGESGSQTGHLLKAATFTGDLLNLIGVDLGNLSVAANILSVPSLRDLVARLEASLTTNGPAFVPPPFIVDLLGLVGQGGVALTAYEGPKDPVGLRVPGVRLARLFDQPILDLKDPENGLLPAYGTDGRFVVASEQEPCRAGTSLACTDYEDTGIDGFVDADNDGLPDDPAAGRPGAGDGVWNDPLALRDGRAGQLPPIVHVSPRGVTEPSNGIVDPVYLFFANPNLNGFFVPLTDAAPSSAEAVSAVTDRDYANPDLMRLLSSIVWIVEIAAAE